MVLGGFFLVGFLVVPVKIVVIGVEVVIAMFDLLDVFLLETRLVGLDFIELVVCVVVLHFGLRRG